MAEIKQENFYKDQPFDKSLSLDNESFLNKSNQD